MTEKTFKEIARLQLVIDEGRSPSAYTDSEGYLTIGVGRMIDRRLDGGLSDDEIEYLLDNDIKKAERDARAFAPNFDDLSEARKAVLVNMAFNLGLSRLMQFVKFRASIAVSDFRTAAAEMMDSKWARQVGRRAERLRDAMLKG